MLRSQPHSAHQLSYEAEGAADATLSAGYGLTFGSDDDKAALPSALGDTFLGVVFADAVVGERISVVTKGPVTAIAGGAIPAGSRVQLAADGRFVAVTDPAAEADGGYAVTSAAAGDDKFTLMAGG